VAVRAVRAVLDGDRDAFAVLVERDLAPVTRVCHRVLGNAADAEDAAQEAFVAAFRSLPDWRGDGPFTAWIARIAVRIAVRRAHQRRPVDWIDVAALDGPDEILDGGARRVARHFADASVDAADLTDPGRIALAAEEAIAVRDALRGLDEPYRETVALRYFAGLTVPEIAAACDRPQGTVKTHLHRGLLRLRERLDAREAAR
jgi:RNA polymerase sigma-70 factor (ECF subfamily)